MCADTFTASDCDDLISLLITPLGDNGSYVAQDSIIACGLGYNFLSTKATRTIARTSIKKYTPSFLAFAELDS